MKSIKARLLICVVFVSLTLFSCAQYGPRIPREEVFSDVPENVSEQIDRLYSSDVKERHDAILKLGSMGKIAAPAVPYITDILHENNWSIRYAAIDALNSIKDERAVEPLIRLLYDKDAIVRKNAAEALGNIKDAKAVDPLIEALGDPDKHVRKNAAEALGNTKDAKAVDPLITILDNEDEFVSVRGEAAKALGNIKDERAFKSLITLLNHKYSSIRLFSSRALNKMDWKPSSKAVRINFFIAGHEWDKLKNFGDNAVEPLIALLNDESWIVRMEAANTLGELGDPKAVKPLINFIKDEPAKLSSIKNSGGSDSGISGLSCFFPITSTQTSPEYAYIIDQNTTKAMNSLIKIGEPAVGEIIAVLDNREYWPIDNKIFIALKEITKEDFGGDYKKWIMWWELKNKDSGKKK